MPACRWLALLVPLAFALNAAPASAFDKQKAAAKMAEQAQSAYESGDYDRAAELYANAFHTDPEPNYLYAQARAEQVGGKPDAATGHLEEFIANPQATPDRVAKARELLDGLHAARLDKSVADGESAARSGDYKLAAQIWLDVARQAPKRVELYYRAGVALQQAADLNGALAAFDAYLQKAPDGLDRSQAKLRRDGVAEKLRPTVARPTVPEKAPGTDMAADKTNKNQTVAPIATTTAPAVRPTPVAGYIVAVAGLAVAAGGVVLDVLTRPDISAYEAATGQTNAAGKIVGIDQQTATSQHTSIQNREIAAVALGGAGLAMAGVGTWLILRTPDAKVTWVPGPALAGGGLAWRF